ncbi:16S rRNA (guanine(966)-N(2))-methyltransferase RsmD [Olsenella sp. DSM 107455]|uniref:16S rRNA (Guanine(966)-N(2))-methyltransferase RsmD n=1 Tax=Thermophilibacter gallinarum TaxID=2779357 RepID=A0ABR9QU02_9ACTN|nr:16S rRNA (guanine(966)-N(2))-methyltransferase RsmD [Thermophilibacter gallinarum]MBE5024558.1 16S rRNA (guanine(966)-N(2))-methyltransferase RsmD [Thermophilibacter gallinarum]
MRIVGGKWRGRQIEAPEGRGTTRPTTDRTREAITSMILSARGLDLTGDSVLDAFAGSGAMGLELLSRGAARATFVDRDRRAAARVRRSAETLGAGEGEVRSLAGDVFSLVSRGLAGAPFDVVFLDPPYAVAAERVTALVDELAASGQLAPGAVVVYERAAEAGGLESAALRLVRTREHGISAVDLLVADAGRDSQ